MFTAAFDAITSFHTAVVAANLVDDNSNPIPVSDGSPLSADTGFGYLLIGYGFDDNPEVVTSALQWVTFRPGNPPREELFSFPSFLLIQSGDTDLAALRASAKFVLNTVEAVLAADRTLAGAVRLCRVSQFQMRQQQATSGASVGVEFHVECEARVT